jgi:hypothetical protein
MNSGLDLLNAGNLIFSTQVSAGATSVDYFDAFLIHSAVCVFEYKK